MVGLGTIVNALSVIVFGSIGLFFKQNLKDRYKVILMQAIGLATLIVGFSGTLNHINKLPDIFILQMILYLVFGSILGTFLKIEERLNNFGEKMQTRFSKHGNFAKGFVSSTLVYCVGAMAILGSLQDGLSQDYSTLFTKSVLDGISSMIFASTLGIGVLFSAIPIVIYQGTITLSASLLQNILTNEIIYEMSAVGNILIIGISLTLLDIKKVNVANMLPAIFLPIFYHLMKPYVLSIIEYLFNLF